LKARYLRAIRNSTVRFVLRSLPRGGCSSQLSLSIEPKTIRAKFHERYRLFFRFSTKDRVIVYAWVNDESSLRKSGLKTDPYSMFQALHKAGTPPASFEQLMLASRKMDPLP
jgi:hypothetical protein